MILAVKYSHSKHIIWPTLANNRQILRETTKQFHSFFFPSSFGHPHEIKKTKATMKKPQKHQQQQYYKETKTNFFYMIPISFHHLMHCLSKLMLVLFFHIYVRNIQ